VHSNQSARSRVLRSFARSLAAAAALGALIACGPKGGREDFAKDGDSGAAAPAAVPTPDHPSGPDSTAGVSSQTGRAQGVAGDTLGGKNTPVKDTTNRSPGNKRP
jgi:hypothetical protein